MKTKLFSLCAVLLVISYACTSPNPEETQSNSSEMVKVCDVHSAVQADKAIVKHLSWDAEVDFDKELIRATATWDIDNNGTSDTIYFDTKGLVISSISLDSLSKQANYSMGPFTEILGSYLAVKIEKTTKQVHIKYTTTKGAAALQWLNKAQTAGKKSPFMFTQSQAILARTWIPCQDSPGIRFTYKAKVQVPKAYLALMSAKNPTEKNNTGIYEFEQEKAIPAYLMALAVGDIAFAKIDEKTGVYAEPIHLQKVKDEFRDMGKMLTAAEKIYGNYAWGRYDVLVLPPSFPFGGMENPVLTFATPTIIAGDRSLVSLIAHELAHSWSGNLVTNATWDDFWLNEGFTVYFERRIMEELEGKDYADMLSYLGYQDLRKTIAEFKAENLYGDTKLKLDLTGRDPDDGVSDIAYEKGCLFLTSIEQAVGRAEFDKFVVGYFSKYAFQSVTTEQFLSYLDANLMEKGSEIYQKIDPEAWVYKPGLPAGFEVKPAQRFLAVDAAVAQVREKDDLAILKTKNWSSHEWQYFLRVLNPDLDKKLMKKLDEQFHFTQTGNSEIAALWLEAAIRANYDEAYPALDAFLKEVGRRKFIKPLYEATQENKKTKEMGAEIYAKYHANYHTVSTATLDKLFKAN